ncbi:hypothetical protein OTU49_007208, partial [Cherax quadricarinatus]
MSLFGSLMRGFDDESFFGGHRSIMRQVDQMMASMIRDPFEEDPFFGTGGGAGGGGGGGGCGGLLAGFPALTAGPAVNALSAVNALNSNALVAAGASARTQRARSQHPFTALGLPSMANMMSSI